MKHIYLVCFCIELIKFLLFSVVWGSKHAQNPQEHPDFFKIQSQLERMVTNCRFLPCHVLLGFPVSGPGRSDRPCWIFLEGSHLGNEKNSLLRVIQTPWSTRYKFLDILKYLFGFVGKRGRFRSLRPIDSIRVILSSSPGGSGNTLTSFSHIF